MATRKGFVIGKESVSGTPTVRPESLNYVDDESVLRLDLTNEPRDGVVFDNSSEGNDGVVSGVTFNDGVVSGGVTISDGAMVFDGTSGRVVTTLVDNSMFTSGFSFSTFYKSNGFSGSADAFIDKSDSSSSASNGFMIFTGGAGNTIRFRINGTDNAVNSEQINDLFNNQYNHLFITVASNGTVNFYFNNVLFGTQVLDKLSEITTTNPLIIGDTSNPIRYLNGSLGHVQLFNRVLTSSERTAIFEAGKDAYSPISDGLVLQLSGKDFLGTPENPTTILDTKTKVSFNGGVGFNFNQD